MTSEGYQPGRKPVNVPKTPLVVDGTKLREGVGGPYYKATGYNAAFVPNIYTTAQTLNTTAKIDTYFSQLRPNSLTRMRAYAPPSASGISWATQLATLDAVVASARKFGQRLIMCFTTWSSIDNTADAFGGKSATWFTSSTYKHSVTGAASFEDWVSQVVARYTGDGVVCIYDVLNEPSDGGSNTAAIASFVTYMSGVIKAIDPSALVYMGIDLVASVGGVTAYETINAGADLCSWHDYAANGVVNVDIGNATGARAISKPWIMDETGVWAKAWYGASGDTDKDDTGWPAVTYAAQGRLLDRKIAAALSFSDCVGVLAYSYMDSNTGGQTDGKGHYEPTNESPARAVLRSAALQGDEFSNDTLASIAGGAWIDGAQAFRYAPGAAITSCIERQVTNTVSITSGTAPTSGRWGKHGSFLFAGAQLMDLGFWKVWDPAATHWLAFVPTALPASSTFGYLLAPQTAVAAMAVRINSSGTVEVLVYAAATTGTIEVTTTNPVVLNQVNTLSVAWSTSSGALEVILNGVTTTAASKKPTLAAANGRVGAAADGTNGFVGHLLEGLNERIVETDTNIGRTLAYFARRYEVVTA